MADIFISYSKADRPLALKLAAMLEAKGWRPGGTPASVIVIWTESPCGGCLETAVLKNLRSKILAWQG